MAITANTWNMVCSMNIKHLIRGVFIGPFQISMTELLAKIELEKVMHHYLYSINILQSQVQFPYNNKHISLKTQEVNLIYRCLEDVLHIF